MRDENFVLRPAVQGDEADLWTFLAIAAYEPDEAAARAIPVVAAHLNGWLRPGDFGVIASDHTGVIGAAWARQFQADENPTFFVNTTTADVSIAVRPQRQGQGIGRALMHALMQEASRRRVDLCLDVRESNPALKLYKELGFHIVPGFVVVNRTGGRSIGMKWSHHNVS